MAEKEAGAERGAPRRRGLLGGMALAGIDQALLSALSLGAAALFIHAAPKAEYGVYTLVAGLVLLGTGVQAALITTPLTTLGARMGAEERRRFVAASYRIQWALALACALLLALVVGWRGGDLSLCVASALSLLGGFQREYLRTVAFLDEQPGRALRGDALYVVLAGAALLAWVTLRGSLSATVGLGAVGLVALLPGPGLLGLARRPGGMRLEGGELRETAALLLRHGRWTLPGMAVTWGGSSGYAYLVALRLGPVPVAELAAARLFVMPLNLAVAAWNRAFLPRAGATIGRGQAGELTAMGRRSVRLLGSLSLAWLALLGVGFALGVERLLPERYRGIEALVWGWCLYGVANALRNVASAVLLALTEFRRLFLLSAVSATVTLGAVLLLVGPLGALGAVLGLGVGEIVLALLAFRAVRAKVADLGASSVRSPARGQEVMRG